MTNSIISFFIQIQLIYLLYLIITNVSATLLILISLKKLILEYYNNSQYIMRKIIESHIYRPVSIIVPAYNEEQTLIASINSFMRLHFPEFEVIVVNDGSNDNSMEKLKKEFQLISTIIPKRLLLSHQKIRGVYKSELYSNLIVIDKENGGKADALNSGINLSQYPLFCCVDADSILEERSILSAMESFVKDRSVVAVGGTVGILNGSQIENNRVTKRILPKRFIESVQVMEYLRGFLSGRTGWEQMNALLIVSGAFGIFRKDIVMKINGYRHTIGEDFDLLVRMRKYCYDNKIEHKVSFIPETMCWTQAPSDFTSLLKQRNRWHRGLLETLYHNRKMILNPKYKIIGMLSLPYFILIEAAGPIITFLGVISLIVLYIYGTINKDTILLFFMLEFVWGISLNILSVSMDIFTLHAYQNFSSLIKLLWLGILEPFIYRPAIKVEQFMASFNFFNANWGEIKRSSIE